MATQNPQQQQQQQQHDDGNYNNGNNNGNSNGNDDEVRIIIKKLCSKHFTLKLVNESNTLGKMSILNLAYYKKPH